MSEQHRAPEPYQDKEEQSLGSKLTVRLAIAGALVGLALATIPLMDSLNGQKVNNTDNGSGNIVGTGSKTASAPLVSTASAPGASAPTASSPHATAPVGPDLGKTPGMTATPPLSLPKPAIPAELRNQARPASTVSNMPGNTQGQTTPAPTAENDSPSSTATLSVHGKPFVRQPQQPATPPVATPQTPVTVQAVQPLPPVEPASTLARPAGTSVGYNVQLGLFSNVENAQKLISDLKSKGITVESETRIHLPPFRTRAEAEQAINRLRSMGYTPMLNVAGN